jgi:hypothetical protein
MVIARMDNFWELYYLNDHGSALPAVFEETLFRGGAVQKFSFQVGFKIAAAWPNCLLPIHHLLSGRFMVLTLDF